MGEATGDGAFYEQLIDDDADGFAAAMESAGIGMYYLDVAEDVQYYNAHLRRALDLGHDENFSRAGAYARLVPPEDIAATRAMVDDMLARGGPITLSVRLLHADGRYVPCATHVVPIRNDAGELVRLIGLVRNLDELERARSRMNEAELMAGLGHWSVDVATGALFWSEGVYHIYGYKPGSIVPDLEFVLDRYVDGERERLDKIFVDAFEGSGRFEFRSWIITQDGERRNVKVIGGIDRDASGKPLSYGGTVQDMTEEVLREAEIRHAQKMEAIGNMTGGVAHDFNNLLAVILGNLEFLRMGMDRDDLIEYCDAAIEATMNGADLTRAMLSFARRAPLNPTTVDVNDIVHGLARWARRTLPANIEIEVLLTTALWKTHVDVASTEAALLNLVLNARDAMPDGGSLTIETANVDIGDERSTGREEDLDPGRYVLLTVSDTGHGIEAAQLQHVFEPFYTTKEPGQGTGLGLSMVDGFMTQSFGSIRVDTKPGVGTTFKLYFPERPDATASSSKVEGDVASATLPAARLLVADDEPLVLEVLVETLTRAGFEVQAARSGDEARALFEADPSFDLLLTDVVMPGRRQGTDLARELRVDRPSLPVIYMSGYPNDATVDGDDLHTADIRLMKPVRRVELLRAIEPALRTASLGDRER